MTDYYINKERQRTGEHEMHIPDCRYFPAERHRVYVGEFNNCAPALEAAKRVYPSADGCYFCCRPCHTR